MSDTLGKVKKMVADLTGTDGKLSKEELLEILGSLEKEESMRDKTLLVRKALDSLAVTPIAGMPSHITELVPTKEDMELEARIVSKFVTEIPRDGYGDGDNWVGFMTKSGLKYIKFKDLTGMTPEEVAKVRTAE